LSTPPHSLQAEINPSKSNRLWELYYAQPNLKSPHHHTYNKAYDSIVLDYDNIANVN